MKKYSKLVIPLVLICLGLALYAFVPGFRSLTQQTAQTTKAVAAHYQLTSSVDAVHLRQIITKDSTTSRTIMWQSELQEPEAVVEFRLAGTEETTTVAASNEAFTDDKTTTYLHTAFISGLKPATKYEYRVGYGNKRSTWHPFTTAGDGPFTALIFPDSQSSDYTAWKETAQPAWKAHQDAQFFINMGDLVDNGEDHSQWNAWFNVLTDIGLLDKIPVAPLLGNHETYNQDWKVRMPAAYLHLFQLPRITPEKYQNQYYSYDYGDVHFTVLNSQIEELSQFQPEMLQDELAWLKQDLAGTNKKWKVVLLHKDVLQYSFQSRPEPRPEGISDTGKYFMPLFDQYKVDVVLTAHLHTYRNRGHIRNFLRDDQGPLYIITGVAGNVRYPSLWKQHQLDVTVAPQPETDNYLVMEASSAKLKFTSYLPSGQQLDTAEVTK